MKKFLMFLLVVLLLAVGIQAEPIQLMDEFAASNVSSMWQQKVDAGGAVVFYTNYGGVTVTCDGDTGDQAYLQTIAKFNMDKYFVYEIKAQFAQTNDFVTKLFDMGTSPSNRITVIWSNNTISTAANIVLQVYNDSTDSTKSEVDIVANSTLHADTYVTIRVVRSTKYNRINLYIDDVNKAEVKGTAKMPTGMAKVVPITIMTLEDAEKSVTVDYVKYYQNR